MSADTNFVLLGIKYEAARLGGVNDADIARIEGQIRAEVGDSWANNKMIIRGRNAVRAEHGLRPLGGLRQETARGPVKRSAWRRLLGR